MPTDYGPGTPVFYITVSVLFSNYERYMGSRTGYIYCRTPLHTYIAPGQTPTIKGFHSFKGMFGPHEATYKPHASRALSRACSAECEVDGWAHRFLSPGFSLCWGCTCIHTYMPASNAGLSVCLLIIYLPCFVLSQ